MKTVSTAEMRELDRRTIEEFGTPGEVLMERAGAGVALCVERLAAVCPSIDPSIVLVAGKGNNGGDVFVTARLLKERGFDVKVLICAEASDVQGDALTDLNLMMGKGITPHELPDEKDWELDSLNEITALRCDIVVDGVLGTGIKGPARGAVSGAIKYINSLAADVFVVAVDIPSGMNSDTGATEGDVVTADITVTMGLPKRGLIEPEGIKHVGSVEVIDIGIPEDYVAEIESDCDLIAMDDFKNVFSVRARDSHKGDYGHALLVGGANGYVGAIAMAAASATRSGVGLVSVVAPKGVAAGVCAVSPESMVHWAEETDIGSLRADCLDKLNIDIGLYRSILIGPGMTTHDDGMAVIAQILNKAKAPVILDADALNLCAGRLELLEKAECPLIMTPHPGEMARLMGLSPKEVQSDRCGAARNLAEQTGAVVVLKGAGTVVCGRGRKVGINMTGNPGMAAGGMGDVLAGLLAGLVAQGIAPFEAAELAVFLHGKAGDRVAWSTSQAGLVAGDVIRELPYVLRGIFVTL